METLKVREANKPAKVCYNGEETLRLAIPEVQLPWNFKFFSIVHPMQGFVAITPKSAN